jgi:hypothetical protein
MSAGDAFHDEMRPLRRRDIDDPEFSELVEEIRAAYVRGPDRAVETRHVSAIASEAKRISLAPMKGRSRLGLLSRLGVVAACLALLSAGLALAGVDLPVLEDADGAAGGAAPSVVRLPDSASDNAVSVIETIQTNLPLLKEGEISGCQFGAMVSAAARGTEPDDARCGRGSGEAAEGVLATIQTNLPLLKEGEISGCEFGAIVSAAARGTDPKSSHCKETATGAGAGKAQAEEAKAAGRAKGEAASEGKANPGGNGKEPSAGSRAKADEARAAGHPGAGGRTRADEAKADGRARGEAASGGKASAGGNKD